IRAVFLLGSVSRSARKDGFVFSSKVAIILPPSVSHANRTGAVTQITNRTGSIESHDDVAIQRGLCRGEALVDPSRPNGMSIVADVGTSRQAGWRVRFAVVAEG